MASANDLERSRTAISDGLWAVANWEQTAHVDAEIVQVQLLTAILTELVAAREDRSAPAPSVKLKWPEDVPKPKEF